MHGDYDNRHLNKCLDQIWRVPDRKRRSTGPVLVLHEFHVTSASASVPSSFVVNYATRLRIHTVSASLLIHFRKIKPKLLSYKLSHTQDARHYF